MAAFAPLIGGEPKVLILGSMPSQVSLNEKQYYANSRNAFWWIMSELFEFDLTEDYSCRSSAIIKSGIAVWDVLYDCQRPGSLDSAIVRISEVPNDFNAFFSEHPSLSRVVFNGIAAETIFNRHNRCLIHEISRSSHSLEWYRCPSTSPAHASMTKQDKLESWRRSIVLTSVT